jgi:hypothetical protein
MKAFGRVEVYLFPVAQQALFGQGPLIIEASRSHPDTHQTRLGPLWTSDQPDAETSTWQHTTLTRQRRSYRRRDSNPQSQQANGRSPTPQTAGTGIGGVEVYLHIFLTSALDWGEWSASRPDRFTSGEKTWCCWLRCWVFPRSGQAKVENRKMFAIFEVNTSVLIKVRFLLGVNTVSSGK